jgi:hypothetical protein
MALPPRGDPRRPLHLAIRSTRLLGGFFVVLGLFSLVPMLLSARAGSLAGMRVYFMASAMVYVVPGALYLLCSICLGRRQFWAVVGGIVLASIQLVFVVVASLGAVIALVSSPAVPPVLFWIMVAVLAFVGLALAQLIYHLARCFEAIKHPGPGEEIRGFEPLAVVPITAPPATGAGVQPIQTAATPPGTAHDPPPQG